jgi:HEAT repeat protein
MIYLTLVAVLMGAADEAPKKQEPVAPSLPALTKEEEAKIETVVERLILADTGRLRGEEARKAVKEFDKLGPEAIPALIRGLQKSAKMSHSCPVVLITKKLLGLLEASTDPILLEYARDEIGAGIRGSAHGRILQDLRFRVTLRKNAVARMKPANTPLRRPAADLSTPELSKAVSTTRGISLHGVLRELGKRDGKEALDGLTRAAANGNSNAKSVAREMLDLHLGRMPASSFGEVLKDSRVEARLGAVRVAGTREPMTPALIERLSDDSAAVRAEALAALKKLSKGEDFGPKADATPDQRREARRKWQKWWDERAQK